MTFLIIWALVYSNESISTQLFNQCPFDLDMFLALAVQSSKYHKIFISFANVTCFCHFHGKFVYFELGMHIRAIGNVINQSFYAVCHSFWYLINN